MNTTEQAQEMAQEAIQIADEAIESRNHWRDRAFQMLRAAKGYRESYLFSRDRWAALREQYDEMQDYHIAMFHKSREQLANARILHLAFLAAGVGLGLVIHHFIF